MLHSIANTKARFDVCSLLIVFLFFLQLVIFPSRFAFSFFAILFIEFRSVEMYTISVRFTISETSSESEKKFLSCFFIRLNCAIFYIERKFLRQCQTLLHFSLPRGRLLLRFSFHF